MKKSISNKIKECKLVSREQFEYFIEFNSKIEESLAMESFFSENKYEGKNTLFDLWNAYGFTDNNLEMLNVGWQSHIKLYHLRFSLMEKWINILFDGKIAFKSFFDVEIEKHNKIRENALKKGIKHLSLTVNFENIALIIDNHFVNIKNQVLAVNLINGAVIKYPTEINQKLVTALLAVKTIDLSSTTQIRDWIKLVTEEENQTMTNRLHYLNVFVNSLKQVEKQINTHESKSYLNGLKSQFIFSIHKTLDLVEWMCESNYNSLELNLKKQFDICRFEHGWKSSLSDF